MLYSGTSVKVREIRFGQKEKMNIQRGKKMAKNVGAEDVSYAHAINSSFLFFSLSILSLSFARVSTRARTHFPTQRNAYGPQKAMEERFFDVCGVTIAKQFLGSRERDFFS